MKQCRNSTGHTHTHTHHIHHLHHHDKCHHLCHFNSLICPAPCLHLSTCFSRDTPGFWKPHSKLGRWPRGVGGKKTTTTKTPRGFLLSEYHVSLAPSCSIIWFSYKPAKVSVKNRTGSEELGNRIKAISKSETRGGLPSERKASVRHL